MNKLESLKTKDVKKAVISRQLLWKVKKNILANTDKHVSRETKNRLLNQIRPTIDL